MGARWDEFDTTLWQAYPFFQEGISNRKFAQEGRTPSEIEEGGPHAQPTPQGHFGNCKVHFRRSQPAPETAPVASEPHEAYFVWATLLLTPLAWAGQGADSTNRPLPTFRSDGPVGFNKTGGDILTPNSYANASVKIVYFRPFHGKLENEVNRALMNEWIQHLNRQVRYASPPSHEPRVVSGAESAMVSASVEDYGGKPFMNLRLAVVASGAIGIVYVWADRDAWANYQTSVEAFLKSIRVESPDRAPAANSSPQLNAARKAIAGLYLGTWMTTTKFYLFSEDGRFYRGQRVPSAPGGDIRRFDYQRARELDSDNSGTYQVTGNELVIQVPGQNPISVPLESADVLEIEGITYKRTDLGRKGLSL